MTEEQVRVLVVDDEEGVRNLLKRILEGAGYQVTTRWLMAKRPCIRCPWARPR